jgi:hypothetical protein
MRKYQALLLALLAVFAVAAVTAGAASAETTLLAEWLIAGAQVLTLTSIETTGELLLTTKVLGIAGAAILCSGIFDGTVGPNGEDEVTELLNLSHELIGSELVGLSLKCTVQASTVKECGEVGAEAELWTDELPWHTLLVLKEPFTSTGTFLDWFLNGGYHVLCLAGKKLENLCSKTLSSALVTNSAEGALGEFNSESELVKCTTGEGEQSNAGAPSLTTSLTGGLVSASSEGVG